jgi:hypothetical protein
LQSRHSRFEAKDAFKRYVQRLQALNGVSRDPIDYLLPDFHFRL